MQEFCAHLTVYQSQVRAGRELSPGAAGWSFLRVCGGCGYLLHGNERREIEAGDLVIIPASANVSLRASQLGDLRLCHFGVRPEQLTGFFTAEEQRALNVVAVKGTRPARVIKREDAVARQYTDFCELRQHESNVQARSAMLSLAVGALRDFLARPDGALPRAGGSEQKLAELAARVPESELLSRSAGELARQCGCTKRHFHRLFAGRFGASLKQRQIEWRIEQAKKLLLEANAKIIDTANQCGFQSLGQFNLTFKRMTRMTPTAWRKAFATTKARNERKHPPVCPRQNRTTAD